MNLFLGILEFPTMSSSGLTRGSLYGILKFFVMRSSGQAGDDTRLGNFRIYSRNSSLEILVRNSSFRNFRLGNSRLRILDLGILEFP